MSKRLSDEDVERIAAAVARKVNPQPPIYPVWIDPRFYQPQVPRYWWNGYNSTSAVSTNG